MAILHTVTSDPYTEKLVFQGFQKSSTNTNLHYMEQFHTQYMTPRIEIRSSRGLRTCNGHISIGTMGLLYQPVRIYRRITLKESVTMATDLVIKFISIINPPKSKNMLKNGSIWHFTIFWGFITIILLLGYVWNRPNLWCIFQSKITTTKNSGWPDFVHCRRCILT